jgi:hypothetical protein
MILNTEKSKKMCVRFYFYIEKWENSPSESEYSERRYKELIAIRENEKQPRELLKLSADSLLGVNCCHCRICIAKIVRGKFI